MTIAKLPLAKEIEEFVFDETPSNGTLVRDLAGGARRRPSGSDRWRLTALLREAGWLVNRKRGRAHLATRGAEGAEKTTEEGSALAQ